MKINLIADWRKAYKFWSIRLAAAASAFIATVLANPDMITNTLNSLPPEARAFISPVVGVVIFGVVYLSRIIDQKKKDQADVQPVAAVTVTESPKPANTSGDTSSNQ